MSDLHNQIIRNQEAAEKDLEDIKNTMKNLEMEMEHKNCEIEEKESQKRELEQKLAEVSDQIKSSPSKELQDNFAKLKQDTEKKDLKIVSLTKVIQKVRYVV